MNPSYWLATGLLALLGWITRVGFHFLAAGLLVGLGGAVQLWSQIALRGLRLRRSVARHDPEVGSPIGMRIEIENPRPVPVPWLRVDDRVGRERLSYLLSIGPYQSVTFENTTLAVERGVLPTGPAILRTTDPFGFRVTRLEGDPAGSILVRPRSAPLGTAVTPWEQGPSSIADLYGRPERKWTVQEPGDALERSLATNRRIRILLDVVGEGRGPTSDQAGNGTERRAAAIPPSLIETAIAVSHAAATRALDLGASVAFDANGLASGKRGRLRIRERAGEEQRRRIGVALARIRAGGRIGLTAILRRALPLGAKSLPSLSRAENPVVLVITVGGCPKARRYLRRLEKQGYEVLVWTIGEAKWFAGSLRIDAGAELDGDARSRSGARTVGRSDADRATNAFRLNDAAPIGAQSVPQSAGRLEAQSAPQFVGRLDAQSTSVPQLEAQSAADGTTVITARRGASFSLRQIDRLVLISARSILRLCWIWPWMQFVSLVSLPERGPFLPLRALITLIVGSWLFGEWMRFGARTVSASLRSPVDPGQAPVRVGWLRRPWAARWYALMCVGSGVVAILLCTWFFEFRTVVSLRDSMWLHLLGEDLLARDGRVFWRLAGILAGIHLWMGSLFDTEERGDRSAIWGGFMITLSLLIVLAALIPVVGLPASLAPTRELLAAFVTLLVGLMRTGPDLGELIEPVARPVVLVQRRSLFSWELLSSQLRGRNGR